MSLLLENINRIIHDSMKNNGIPGAAVAVIKENKVILSQGFGRTNVEDWGTPVSSNTLFRIASVSKLFTGTLMMRLVEKGIIDLDKPVQYYVHWFTAADPELSKLITIRMLLTHSSGLPTGGGLSFHHDEEGLFRYMKEIVPTVPILFHPGTAYSYGNHGLNIAGFVAEQVTNKKFDVLMQELLFDPLEMDQTTYNPLKAMTYPLALPHDRDNEGNPTISHQFLDNTASYPSYYAFSSIDDLYKFAMMHLQDGVYKDTQLLSSSSIKEMRKEQIRWYTLTEAGCGINFFRETKDGVDRFWHYGQYSNQYSSQFILVPEKGIAVIALANGENIFQAGYEIADELLKDESKQITNPAAKPHTQNYPDWKAFEGSYLHSYYGLLKICLLDGRVYIKHNGEAFELLPYSTDTYFAKNDEDSIIFTVGFPAPGEGQTIKCIVVNSNACPAFTPDYTPNPSEWESWTGIYCDERDSYSVSIQEDILIITDNQTNKELIGQAIGRNQFLTKEYGLLSFIDVKDTITLEFGYAWRYPKQS